MREILESQRGGRFELITWEPNCKNVLVRLFSTGIKYNAERVGVLFNSVQFCERYNIMLQLLLYLLLLLLLIIIIIIIIIIMIIIIINCRLCCPNWPQNKTEMTFRDYMYHEKREEEDLTALKTALSHRYNDSKTIYKNTMEDWKLQSKTILITQWTTEW